MRKSRKSFADLGSRQEKHTGQVAKDRLTGVLKQDRNTMDAQQLEQLRKDLAATLCVHASVSLQNVTVEWKCGEKRGENFVTLKAQVGEARPFVQKQEKAS